MMIEEICHKIMALPPFSEVTFIILNDKDELLNSSNEQKQLFESYRKLSSGPYTVVGSREEKIFCIDNTYTIIVFGKQSLSFLSLLNLLLKKEGVLDNKKISIDFSLDDLITRYKLSKEFEKSIKSLRVA